MFLTQPQDITCIHEPFCDAYHFGPERLSERYTEEQLAQEEGYKNSTYKAVLDMIWSTKSEVSLINLLVPLKRHLVAQLRGD